MLRSGRGLALAAGIGWADWKRVLEVRSGWPRRAAALLGQRGRRSRVGPSPASSDRASPAFGPAPPLAGFRSLLGSAGYVWYVMVTAVLVPFLLLLAVIVPAAPWKVPVPPVTLP